MKTFKITNFLPGQHIIMATIIAIFSTAISNPSFAGALKPLIDDFSNMEKNSLGIERQFLNDSLAGGNTTTEQKVSKGIMHVKGKIVPPRGQPGWASSVLPLDAQGLPQNASAFEGIRLRVKVNKGNLSISANSTEVTNFDYHAATITVRSDGKFHEVKIPFTTMKRSWSEQTPLNTKSLNSLSIVAYSPKKGAFDFEVDNVSFYKPETR